MPTNWPPAGAPTWPPPEINSGWLSTSDIRALVSLLQDAGFMLDNPTTTERNTFFKTARCDHGDSVIGRMIVSPSGVRYPFAVCNNAAHRDLLVLWPPYYCGWDSGKED